MSESVDLDHGVDENAPESTAEDFEEIWVDAIDARTSRFRWRLLVISALAFGVRLLYVLVVTKRSPLAGDALYYSAQGQVIAQGKGFAAPFYFAGTMPAADHPPLAPIVMALGPLIAGTKSMLFGMPLYVFLQRLTMVVVGTLTVAVIGATGRRAAGRGSKLPPERIGLVAALIAAFCPSLWVNDGILMSESVAALALAAVIWAALVAWDNPTVKQWTVLGLAIGVAALARAESISLLLVLAVPMIVMRHRRELPKLIGVGTAVAVSCLAVCATWLVPNSMRFEERTLFSTNDGLTWLGANCPETYHGEWRGVWTLGCLRYVDTNHNGRNDADDLHSWSPYDKATEDASQISKRYQSAAFDYIGNHASELPKLMVVRVARSWGAWRPDQMAEYNRGEGRGLRISWLAWAVHIAMLPFALLGLLALRRAGRPTWPFVSQAVVVTLTSALIYGLARFRLGWDVAACVLAAVGLVVVLQRLGVGRRRVDD